MQDTDVAEIGALERSFNVMAGSLEKSRDELAAVLAEQAALRRVATLVARGAAPAEVFAETAKEVGRLLGTNATALCRYEPDGTATLLALETDADLGISVGARISLEGENAAGAVLQTGRAARQESFERATGTLADLARVGRMDSSVGAPILVEGRLWGVVVVTSRGRVPPADTERRLGDFTELVATTISNTDARAQVERLAAEQAALRRVATLVAEGGSPTMVFDGVAAEMEGLLDADQVAVSRYEPGDEVTVVALRGRVADSRLRPGTRIGHGEDSATALVRRTEKPARVEYAPGAGGLIAEFVRTRGARVSLGAPIVVDGRLWGVIQASWDQEESPPAGTEVRMAQFGKLLDTAIANADTHDQLKASRARLVAAGDEARRRMVRDLHDGVQQRLVHTIIVLKQAAHALPLNHDDVEPLLAEAIAQGTEANAELRELVHGILPAVLTRGGLAAGIDALVSRSPVPVAVTVPRERFSAEVEATAYFVVAEALTNIAKHARAQSVEVRVRIEEGALRIEVRDDGVGGADPGGDGLLGLADRIAALDGELRLESPPGGGTRITAAIRLPG
jgi:signal transduction histidine kinase